MTRAKCKAQVRQYTKRNGTQVKAHERRINLRFEPIYRNPYYSEGCVHCDDPLVETLEYSGVVIGCDDAIDNCEHMNDLYAKEDKSELVQWLVDNHQMGLKEAAEGALWKHGATKVDQAHAALMVVFTITKPGTQERFDAVDKVTVQYGGEIMEQAFPVEVQQ